MSDQLNFLYQAVADVQATIRAIDVKIGFIFVVLFLPIAGYESVANIYYKLLIDFPFVSYYMFGLIVLWAVSFCTLFTSVGAISTPSTHIKDGGGSGIYHGANLYRLNALDLIVNFPIKSELSIAEAVKVLPETVEEIVSEMTFELLKVSYIRDIKKKRFMFSLKVTFLWVVGGGILVLSSYATGVLNVNG